MFLLLTLNLFALTDLEILQEFSTELKEAIVTHPTLQKQIAPIQQLAELNIIEIQSRNYNRQQDEINKLIRSKTQLHISRLNHMVQLRRSQGLKAFEYIKGMINLEQELQILILFYNELLLKTINGLNSNMIKSKIEEILKLIQIKINYLRQKIQGQEPQNIIEIISELKNPQVLNNNNTIDEMVELRKNNNYFSAYQYILNTKSDMERLQELKNEFELLLQQKPKFLNEMRLNQALKTLNNMISQSEARCFLSEIIKEIIELRKINQLLSSQEALNYIEEKHKIKF